MSVWDRVGSACACGEQRDLPGAGGGHSAGHSVEWPSKGGTAPRQSSGKSPHTRTEMEKPCLCQLAVTEAQPVPVPFPI